MGKKRERWQAEFNRRFGKRIVRARLEAGLAQWHLAVALKTTIGPIQHIEHGRYGVAASQIAAIAEITGKPIDWFFKDGAGDRT